LEHRYTLSETTKCSKTDKGCDRERSRLCRGGGDEKDVASHTPTA